MSQAASDTAYLDAAASLTPAVVSQYLAATPPWQLESRQERVKEIWSLPGPHGGINGRIMLPLATDYADFGSRFADALHAVGALSGWDAKELVRRIDAMRVDVLFLRLDQPSDDGTIPLKQAEVTIDSLQEMMRSAAISTAAPGRRQRGGRLPSLVSDFLAENVRLGHTKQGSFTFTVVTRLDGRAEFLPVLFPRRVMETLARSLEAIRDLVQRRAEVTAEQATQAGLTVGFLESLENIAGNDELRSLEVSFDWAAVEAAPEVGASPIRLRHDHLAELARIRELLQRHQGPSRHETLIGTVRSLAREDESGDAGSVVVSAEIDGRKRNVHMLLSGEHHDRAIEAYKRERPLIVTGDLIFERQAWRLTGEIQVDASELPS